MTRLKAFRLVSIGALVAIDCGGGDTRSAAARTTDLAAEVPPLAQALQAPQVATDTSRIPRVLVEVSCSETRRRTGVAVVRWSPRRLEAPDSVKIDYTVFKGGFETGQYGSLGTGREPKAELQFRPGRTLTALELQVFPEPQKSDSSAVRAERLDPGVNYWWRIRARIGGKWLAGAATRATAPTCVSDEPLGPR